MKRTNEQIRNDVVDILLETFEALDDAYEKQKEGTIKNENLRKIIFPQKYDGSSEKTRISEQELRFEFVHQLLVGKKDYNYSIETPTKTKYIFSGKGCADDYPKIDNNGESARFDLVLFDGQDRCCYIEFKAHNADAKEYEKDILKLNTDTDDKPCFFVNLLESTNTGTIPSILSKLLDRKTKHGDRYLNYEKKDLTFIYHCLSNNNKKKKETRYYGINTLEELEELKEIEQGEIERDVRNAVIQTGKDKGTWKFPQFHKE